MLSTQTSWPAWARDGREHLAEGRKERDGNKTGGSEGMEKVGGSYMLRNQRSDWGQENHRMAHRPVRETYRYDLLAAVVRSLGYAHKRCGCLYWLVDRQFLGSARVDISRCRF